MSIVPPYIPSITDSDLMQLREKSLYVAIEIEKQIDGILYNRTVIEKLDDFLRNQEENLKINKFNPVVILSLDKYLTKTRERKTAMDLLPDIAYLRNELTNLENLSKPRREQISDFYIRLHRKLFH